MKSAYMLILVGLVLLLAGPALAQAPGGATDYDLLLVPSRDTLRPGDQFQVDALMNVRKPGVVGWSYGVEHDEDSIDLLSVSVATEVTQLLASPNFSQTQVNRVGDRNIGWTQVIILSLGAAKPEIPVVDNFPLATANYQVRSEVCAGGENLSSSIFFSGELSVPPGPRIEVILSVEENPVVPAVQSPADLTLACLDLDLLLIARPVVARKLTADRVDTLDIEIVLENNTTTTQADLQGWSYGLALDPAVLEVVDLVGSSSVSALNGGTGPDFQAYNRDPLERNGDGSVQGITVAVAISVDNVPPLDEVLPLPGAQSLTLEVMTVRSALVLSPGAPDRTTELNFVDQILGNPVVENLITVEGLGIPPVTESPSLTLTLAPPGAQVRFRRGFVNSDDRVDIADGITIIQVLFYGKGPFLCDHAADVNDDGRNDIADAMYIFSYQFQPGVGSGQPLFPPPGPPFVQCGLDTTPQNDNLTCQAATGGCN